MEQHVQLLELASNMAMAAVDYIDREKVRMLDSYPDWDDADTAEIKAKAIQGLNNAIAKLNEI